MLNHEDQYTYQDISYYYSESTSWELELAVEEAGEGWCSWLGGPGGLNSILGGGIILRGLCVAPWGTGISCCSGKFCILRIPDWIENPDSVDNSGVLSKSDIPSNPGVPGSPLCKEYPRDNDSVLGIDLDMDLDIDLDLDLDLDALVIPDFGEYVLDPPGVLGTSDAPDCELSSVRKQ